MFAIACHILLLVHLAYSQQASPCPEIFSYEPRGQEEDRWYGVISLQTAEELHGIWLRITLDRKADLLGNWFGDATSTDNIQYVIKNQKYTLEAGPPVSVRFFVKYNAASTIPSLKAIHLNGKVICGERVDASTVAPPLHISQQRPNRPSSSRPTNLNSQEITQTSDSRRPSSGESTRPDSSNEREQTTNSGTSSNGLSAEKNGDEYDFFPGDLAFNRPNLQRPASRPSSINRRTVRCGTVVMNASPLISYGQNTSKGQWPWHAAIFHTQGPQLMYTCGATLISENHIVTAAHCVTRPQTNRPIDTHRLTIYLGKHSLKKFDANTQDREVAEIFVHPDYNHNVYFNDIAVLKLKTPVDFTNYVRPCCIWEDDESLEKVISKLGTVVGWGFDERRQISDQLMQAEMPVVKTDTCIYSNREFFSQFTFEKNFCAGFRNGTSVCNGDSGGGMVFPKPGTSGQNKVWQLRGIVSVGVALQGQGVCDPNHYIVFTDVAKHVNWIRRVLRE